MRFLTLAIALFALAATAYISFSTPSRADVFGDSEIASAAPAR